MKIKNVLSNDCVIADLKSSSKEDVISELIQTPIKKNNLDRSQVTKILIDRENLGSTGIGKGIAIPHGKIKDIDKIIASFGRSLKGIPFDAQDGNDVHCFFVLLAPDNATSAHLEILQRISQIFVTGTLQKTILKLTNPIEIYNAIIDEDEKYV